MSATIRGEIRNCRRGEHFSHLQYRRWLRFFVNDKLEGIETYLIKFAEKTLTRDELETLLQSDNANRLIGATNAQTYLQKYDNKTLTETDMESILDNVFALHFTINDIIQGVSGVDRKACTYDEFKKEYGRAQGFLAKDRRLMEHLIYVFLTPDEIKRRREQGWTDEQLIKEFVDVCISENLYPLINANPIIFKGGDGYYKPLTLSMWTKHLTFRMRSIANEIERSGREIIALESRGIKPGLPSADGKLQQALQAGQDPYKKLGLPMPKLACQLCGGYFDNDTKLRRHLIYKHHAKP